LISDRGQSLIRNDILTIKQPGPKEGWLL